MAQIHLPRQVGIIVAAARNSQNLTQAQIAEQAGVSRQLVNRLETGSADGISLAKLLAILDVVGCTIDIHPLGSSDDFDQSFAPEPPARATPSFNPLAEYPLDESLFEEEKVVSS